MPAVDDFTKAMAQAGLTLSNTIIPDGTIHRFASNGKADDDCGWYVFHDDGVPAGVFGDWRTGLKETWCAKSDRQMTAQEREAHRQRIETIKREREAEDQRRHAEAADDAQRIWNAATPAPANHPYLDRKKVKAHGLRIDVEGDLLIPAMINGVLSTLQFINAHGNKLFLSGGEKKAGSYTIGTTTDNAVLCLAEGYATAATIHEATGYPTVMAFDAGNLKPVAQALRAKHPQATIILCADNDVREDGTPNTGIISATAAAKAIGGWLAIPEIDGKKCDFNDVHVQRGLDAVKTAIESAIRSNTMTTATIEEDRAATATDNWPALDAAALHGLAGEAVRLLSPHTEADEVALLVSFLAESGAMLNRGPHLILDGSVHPLLFWPVVVGQSSKSRKGTAGKRIERLMRQADPTWLRGEYKGTLSSGEGLAFAVRDPSYNEVPVKENGKFTGETVRVLADSGVEDKRLFLVQPEFGSVLRIMAREGNSLSGVLRDAWDGLTLAPMTKANRVRATDPHIGIVGHVTKDELLRNLTDTETVNGFGNRFGWFAVRRSKELPFSSAPSETDLSLLAAKIGKALGFARGSAALSLTDSMREGWKAVYHDLSADRPGMAGALLGRSEAQVMRLAALYAVLDGHSAIDLQHLKAGLALWQYAEASALLIFGDNLGDPIADTILRALRASRELSDTQISDLFGRHLAASKLERGKTVLLTAGLAHCVTVETGGRPRITWKPGAKQAS